VAASTGLLKRHDDSRSELREYSGERVFVGLPSCGLAGSTEEALEVDVQIGASFRTNRSCEVVSSAEIDESSLRQGCGLSPQCS
jgi:hypothetical protein